MTDQSLAQQTERAAIAALHAAADDGLRERLGLTCAPLGEGLMSAAARLPASAIVVNRTLGLSKDDTDRARNAYRDLGVTRYFLQFDKDPGRPPEGLQAARSWQRFTATDPVEVPVNPEIEVVGIDRSRGQNFAAVVCRAFDLGTQAEPWLARLPEAGGWRVFLGLIGGEVAGAGALFQCGDQAWSDFGGTAPTFRRRGVQRALLAHRVRTAFGSGARAVHTCTGVAVPGEAQSSYHNIRACGFRETEIEYNLAPPKPV